MATAIFVFLFLNVDFFPIYSQVSGINDNKKLYEWIKSHQKK